MTHLAMTALLGLAIGLALSALISLTAASPRATTRVSDAPPLLDQVVELLTNLFVASAPGHAPAVQDHALPLDAYVVASPQPRRTDSMSADTAAASVFVHRVHSAAWSEPVNLSASQDVPSKRPVVVAAPDGTIHALWEEDDRLFYRNRVNGQWSTPVAVVSGRQPAAAVGPDGTVFVVYVNEFMEHTNVFFMRLQEEVWSLPRLVSRTSGVSLSPAVAVDGNGGVHVVWADRTPGYFVIYHARLEETWLYAPIPNARGAEPRLVYNPMRDLLHVVWQSPTVGSDRQDIFHVQGFTHAWSLPENISASLAADAVNAALAVDAQGAVHLVWQERAEGRSQVKYASGWQGNWTAPQLVTPPEANAEDPTVVITHANQLSVVWREGNTIFYRRRSGNEGTWHPSKPLISNNGRLSDLVLAADVAGRLHLAWSAGPVSAEPDVYHSMGEPSLSSHVFLPTTPVSR